MLLTSLWKAHGEWVTILTNLSIPRHAVLKLDNFLFEFFRPDLVGEKELALSRNFSRINVVPAEVEDFVIDVDH